MIKNNFIAKLSGLGFFYRWHPEVALRYLPIVDKISSLKKSVTIADIGSGGLGMAPYIKKKIIGVDIDFLPPYHPRLERIKGSALKLPFKKNAFNIVVSVDMLEHLHEAQRNEAIEEMLRIAEDFLFIAVPSGKKAYQQDVILDKEFKDKYGKSYGFLDEQVHLGLPEEDDIISAMEKAAALLKKEITIEVQDNENLNLRAFLMKGWLSHNFFVQFTFRKLMLFCIPLFRLFNQKPSYRKIFFVEIL